VDDLEARELVARVEQLLDDVEAITDPAAREAATEMAGVLLDLYGEGIARLAALVPDPGALAQDELVSHLLLLHGIHPVPVEDRVRAALDEVRPYLDSHGGGVELLEVVDGTVRLRMRGSCSGCPSSAVTLKLAIEEAIRKHAPDVDEIEAQDAEAAPALIALAPPAPTAANGNGWQTAGSLPQLRADGTVLKDIAKAGVFFLVPPDTGQLAKLPADAKRCIRLFPGIGERVTDPQGQPRKGTLFVVAYEGESEMTTTQLVEVIKELGVHRVLLDLVPWIGTVDETRLEIFLEELRATGGWTPAEMTGLLGGNLSRL